jgi:hypothetical protein
MTLRSFRLLIVLAASVALLATGEPFVRGITGQESKPRRPRNNVLARAMDIEMGRTVRLKYEAPVSSGVMYAAREFEWEMERPDAVDLGLDPTSSPGSDPWHPPADQPSFGHTQGCQNVFVGNHIRNIRVNQDCSFRRQAEEAIAINPKAPYNLIVGYNDSRIGFNHGAYAWTFDRGKTWGDQVPPFWQFVLNDGHTADAFSDPTATFDADGNAYISNVLFDVNAAASAITVMKSNAGIGGAFFHTPNSTLSLQTFRTTPNGVVASDNDPSVFHDKELMVADANVGSPKKNNVYVTWTRFATTGVGVGGNSPIYFSQSTNGGRTWSKGIEISGANVVACSVFQGEAQPGACDQDQGSHPVVGPDGTIYVAFNNGNTPTAVNNQLLVKCLGFSDCSLPGSWTAPVKIADDVSTQPRRAAVDPVSGCPAGRQCLPPNGYRMNDFGALSVDGTGKLYFVWSDFRNGGLSCNFAVPGPCNNDVFYAYSTNGGATWSAPVNVTPASKFGVTAQWQAWGAVAPNGNDLWIGFYDRSYGACEATGCNDVTLAQVSRPASLGARASYTRITTSSMPNLVPANNPIQAGFLGDYMWVAADANGRPHIVWADTRGRQGTVEEDVYYAKLGDFDDEDDGR